MIGIGISSGVSLFRVTEHHPLVSGTAGIHASGDVCRL